LENLVNPAVPPADRTIEKARSIARAEWDKFEAENRELASLALNEEKLREMRQWSWHAISGYFAMEDPATVEVVATEQRLRGSIGGVPFTGVVDRLTAHPGGVCVDDYKTGRAPNGAHRSEKLAQTYLYAAFLAGQTSPVDRVRLLYVSAGEEVAATVDESLMASTVDKLGHTWGRIQEDFSAGSFTPKPGPLCRWCPYSDGRCPVFQAAAA
jgi:putative RecB family exonuclease